MKGPSLAPWNSLSREQHATELPPTGPSPQQKVAGGAPTSWGAGPSGCWAGAEATDCSGLICYNIVGLG